MLLLKKDILTSPTVYFLYRFCLVIFILLCSVTLFSQPRHERVKENENKAMKILKESFKTYATKEKLCINGLATKSTIGDENNSYLITKFELIYVPEVLLKLNWWNNLTGSESIMSFENEIYSVDNKGVRTRKNSIASEIFLMSRKTGSQMIVLGILLRGDYPAKSDDYSLKLLKESVINNENYQLIHWKSLDTNDFDKFINSFDIKFWINKETKLIYKIVDSNQYNGVMETVTEYYFYDNECSQNVKN